jgi:type IV pilus assembly protein PilQ
VLALVLLVGLAATAAERDVLIALDVKDAQAPEIIQVLAETAGLQVVFDPGLSCRLTLKLNAVSYERAFETVLRACRFDYEGEGNVLRVATIARLSQEASERRRLADAQREAAPRREVRLRLSYARATEMATLLKRVLSPRAEVVVDERTHTGDTPFRGRGVREHHEQPRERGHR